LKIILNLSHNRDSFCVYSLYKCYFLNPSLKAFGNRFMKLDEALVNEQVWVAHIPDPAIAATAMQFGISEGECLLISAKAPGGPVVVQRGQFEVALGRELCQGIEVRRV
jgi:Fe2+ transport system protein FeoA